MKHDWKKDEKSLYKVPSLPSLIEVPAQKFVMIEGKGDPNKADFSERVGSIYPISYPIKMKHKDFCKKNPELASKFEYQEYSIFPLEGLWTSEGEYDFNKDNLVYTIMIRQPDFITEEMFAAAFAEAEKKKPNPLLREVKFGVVEDGLCVQIFHVGSFDDEVFSFEKMDLFTKESGYVRKNHVHREIYLNDPRKTAPENRKTILRYQVQKI